MATKHCAKLPASLQTFWLRTTTTRELASQRCFPDLEERPARFPVLLVSACAGPEDLKHLRSASTFTIELLGDLDSETLIPAILKYLTDSKAPPPGKAVDDSKQDGRFQA